MHRLYNSILTILISSFSFAQVSSSDEINPYEYDTTLRGGYTISFRIDDTLQHLFLKKGIKTITELSSTSRGLPYKNLGYLGADFKDYFVLVHSFGSGNPHYIELVKKTNGKNILKGGSAWIDVDTVNQILLYSKRDVPDETDSMTLVDLKNMTQKNYAFPKEIFDGPEKLNRIRIITVSDRSFTIEYDYKDWSITKRRTYSRY